MSRVAVIGGGAAGMAAAIEAAERGMQVVLFEHNDQLGRKILATGNGRCNISNVDAERAEDVETFFRKLGILLRREDGGRLYPYSAQARSIRDIMAERILQQGVEVRLGSLVNQIRFDDIFLVVSEDGSRTCEFDAVVVAAGGKAGVQLGATGDGYRFARELGHEVKSPLPALVPLLADAIPAGFGGVRAKARVQLFDGEDAVASAGGEVQFTDYGLSGICIFDLSSYLREIDKDKTYIEIDFAPDISSDEIDELDYRSIINEKLLDVINSADMIKGYRVKVDGTKGWKQAQVTSGGVLMNEVDQLTMQSKLVPGLFLAGEVLDKDFPCGGFNLNWAFLSGMLAGQYVGT